jgi:LysM repeat protein
MTVEILAVRRSVAVVTTTVAVTVALAACGEGATPSPVVTPAPTAAPETAPPTIEPTVPPEPSAEVTIYVVKKGDTLYGIAKEFGITAKALQAANPQVSDPRLMQIGEKLVIPAP